MGNLPFVIFRESGPELFLGRLVITGFTARLAIIETVLAEADIHLGLAKAAVTLALAAFLGHLALQAAVAGLSGGGHEQTVARAGAAGKFRW